MPRIDLPPEQYYSQLARVRQGAGALITTRDGRIVMIDTSYRDFYEIPGGAVERERPPPSHVHANAARSLALKSTSDDCW
jgi:hypothetical protein